MDSLARHLGGATVERPPRARLGLVASIPVNGNGDKVQVFDVAACARPLLGQSAKGTPWPALGKVRFALSGFRCCRDRTSASRQELPLRSSPSGPHARHGAVLYRSACRGKSEAASCASNRCFLTPGRILGYSPQITSACGSEEPCETERRERCLQVPLIKGTRHVCRHSSRH